eukprot:1136980-Pelagomonas_calceolata.AAC.3
MSSSSLCLLSIEAKHCTSQPSCAFDSRNAVQLNVAEMAKDNPHDIGRLLDSTVLSFAKKMSGNLSRCVCVELCQRDARPHEQVSGHMSRYVRVELYQKDARPHEQVCPC